MRRSPARFARARGDGLRLRHPDGPGHRRYWALHFHGGYGFMLEYDIQLYYRRSRAWARVLMDSARPQRVADRATARPALEASGDGEATR